MHGFAEYDDGDGDPVSQKDKGRSGDVEGRTPWGVVFEVKEHEHSCKIADGSLELVTTSLAPDAVP